MKRVPIERWGGSFLPPRNPRLQCFASTHIHTRASSTRPQTRQQRPRSACDRPQHRHSFTSQSRRQEQQLADAPHSQESAQQAQTLSPSRKKSREPQSAKLAALHARLSLPARFPLRTLARCLIDATADPRSEHNNISLATLGQDLLGYYTSEWLICHYPRLPIPILLAAQGAYVGDKTLALMRAEWGVEVAAAPGNEVDAGILQLSRVQAGNAMGEDMMSRAKDNFDGIKMRGTGRSNEQWAYRRGMSSRIVYDDQFGDLQSGVREQSPGPQSSSADDIEESLGSDLLAPGPMGATVEAASATFIRAVFGALYLHSGTAVTQAFHSNHILSRHLPLHTLFDFKYPTRDLSFLCKREGFEQPVARLISETGRLSRSPVFIVGVYSGDEKLGEDAGSSLDEGRVRAAAAALRSWYLYSPPQDDITLPSSATAGAKFKPQMVDVGEIVT